MEEGGGMEQRLREEERRVGEEVRKREGEEEKNRRGQKENRKL